jgi:membrane fusion protein, adhesin transport system
MSQTLFKVLGKTHDFFMARTWLTKPVHYLLEKWAPSESEEDRAWLEDAELAILDQAPLRAKKILYLMIASLVVLVAWAGITKIDEITRGEGRVIPSQQVQIIQSYDGGIVAELLVHEGSTVTKGQALVKIDQTRAVSSLRENRSQYLSLLARQSRLKALANGTEFVQDEEIKTEAPEIYIQEYALYSASKAELESQVAVLAEQVKQRERELAETQAKLQQANDGLALTNQEIAVTMW